MTKTFKRLHDKHTSKEIFKEFLMSRSDVLKLILNAFVPIRLEHAYTEQVDAGIISLSCAVKYKN